MLRRQTLAFCLLLVVDRALAEPTALCGIDASNRRVVRISATLLRGEPRYTCVFVWSVDFDNGSKRENERCEAEVVDGTTNGTVCQRAYPKTIKSAALTQYRCTRS
ncbi:MAG: hypothetical protein ABI592_13665 [Acidobacteriota bacterium]